MLRAHYVKPPFVPAELDVFVESMLSTRVGDSHYPGHVGGDGAGEDVGGGAAAGGDREVDREERRRRTRFFLRGKT